MNDRAHKETDREIERINKYIAKLYNAARKGIVKDYTAFVEFIKKESDELLKAIKSAESNTDRIKAKMVYRKFFQKLIRDNELYQKSENEAKKRLYAANTAAVNLVNKKTAKIYAQNYNQTGKGIQEDLYYLEEYDVNGIDYSWWYDFTPVEEEEADKYGRITRQEVSEKKDNLWNEQNIRSAILTAALLGLSAKDVVKRTANVVTEKNYNVAVRQVSDTMTDAENKGRLDSMYRADDEGFSVKKYWIATLDNRTRETHQEYDGMKPVELDYEYAPGLKRPRDPDCSDLSEVCNCRCTLQYDMGHGRSSTRAAREGDVHGSYKKASSFTGTHSKTVADMTYKEWMKWRSK